MHLAEARASDRDKKRLTMCLLPSFSMYVGLSRSVVFKIVRQAILLPACHMRK